jgi:hypothetical protein
MPQTLSANGQITHELYADTSEYTTNYKEDEHR